jgi:hypothetical protein
MQLMSAVVVVAALVAGMMYFQKMESKIADVVWRGQSDPSHNPSFC